MKKKNKVWVDQKKSSTLYPFQKNQKPYIPSTTIAYE